MVSRPEYPATGGSVGPWYGLWLHWCFGMQYGIPYRNSILQKGLHFIPIWLLKYQKNTKGIPEKLFKTYSITNSKSRLVMMKNEYICDKDLTKIEAAKKICKKIWKTALFNNFEKFVVSGHKYNHHEIIHPKNITKKNISAEILWIKNSDWRGNIH